MMRPGAPAVNGRARACGYTLSWTGAG